MIYVIQILSKVSVINLLKIGNFKLCPLELSNMLYLQSIASNFKLYWSWHWMIEDLNFSKTFLVSSSETSEQIYIFLLDNKSTSMAFHSIDIFKIFQDNCLILHKRIWWNFYLKYFIFFMKYFIFPYFVTFNSNNSSVCFHSSDMFQQNASKFAKFYVEVFLLFFILCNFIFSLIIHWSVLR